MTTTAHAPSTDEAEVDTPEAALALDPEAFQRVLVDRNRGVISPEDQARIGAARVLVAGCGSIGGAAVEPLIRCGFRDIVIAEPGTYELTNLNRQNATVADLGRNKAVVARERALAINPHARVRVVGRGVHETTVDELLEGVDIVVDGVDVTTSSGLRAKVLLHERVSVRRLPLVTGWDMSGTQYVRVYDYRTGLAPFAGALRAEDVDRLPMWALLARLVPRRYVPRDLIRLVRGAVGQDGFTFPQLVNAADQFGVLATTVVVRLATGRKVPTHMVVDVHRATSPRATRVVDDLMRPLEALRLARAILRRR